MNYENPDLDRLPAIALQESQNEAAACAQMEYDQAQQIDDQTAELPF